MTVPNCLLALDAEATVPAQEAGVLMKIPVREGQQVAAGDLLAQIDDAIPQMQYNVACYKLEVAKKQAADDIDVRFATAAAAVAKADYDQAEDANEKVREHRSAGQGAANCSWNSARWSSRSRKRRKTWPSPPCRRRWRRPNWRRRK